MIETLSKIQTELKAPKGQFNKFGGYAYRSAEDILEAVKPLIEKYNVALTISDEVILVGTRFYIKATATLKNKDNAEISASAYAREPEDKKGMDSAQITGATSSYARKYALNGLLAIDDEKDADTQDNTNNLATPNSSNTQKPKQTKNILNQEQISDLTQLIEVTQTDISRFLAAFNVKDLQFVPYEQAKDMLLKKLAIEQQKKQKKGA